CPRRPFWGVAPSVPKTGALLLPPKDAALAAPAGDAIHPGPAADGGIDRDRGEPGRRAVQVDEVVAVQSGDVDPSDRGDRNARDERTCDLDRHGQGDPGPGVEDQDEPVALAEEDAIVDRRPDAAGAINKERARGIESRGDGVGPSLQPFEAQGGTRPLSARWPAKSGE